MDRLQSLVRLYSEELMCKRFICTYSDNGGVGKIKLRFKNYNFAHLIGVHKCTDICIGDHASEIFNRIKQGRLTEEDLKKSKFYPKIEKRIAYFEKIRDLIYDNKDYLREMKNSDDDEESWSKIKAKYMLSKYERDNPFVEKNGHYLHLFFTFNNDGSYYPISFILNPNGRYIGLNKKYWRIIDISEDEEFTKNNPVKKNK